MGWMNQLIHRHNKKATCLICEEAVLQDAAVIEYQYKDGVGKAFLCPKCEKEMSKSNLDFDDE